MGVAGLQRIEKFRSETTAVIEYYEGKGVLRKVDAAETVRTVGCLVSIHQCNIRYCRVAGHSSMPKSRPTRC